MQDGQISMGTLRLQGIVQKHIQAEKDIDRRSSHKHSLAQQQMTSIYSNIENFGDKMEEIQEFPEAQTDKQLHFNFIVSSSSSDASLSMSPLLKSCQKQPDKQKEKFKDKMDQIDQVRAIHGLKSIMKRKASDQKSKEVTTINHRTITNSSTNVLSPRGNVRSLAQASWRNQELMRDRGVSIETQNKKPINFLQGLNQNQNLKESATIEEYYQDGKIIVNMNSKDLMVFVRLQHEVDELKRKQDDFNEQKERHFNQAKKEMQLNLKRKLETKVTKKNYSAWWYGVSLAKRFLRRGRKCQTQSVPVNRNIQQQEQQQPQFRLSTIKNNQMVDVQQQ